MSSIAIIIIMILILCVTLTINDKIEWLEHRMETVISENSNGENKSNISIEVDEYEDEKYIDKLEDIQNYLQDVDKSELYYYGTHSTPVTLLEESLVPIDEYDGEDYERVTYLPLEYITLYISWLNDNSEFHYTYVFDSMDGCKLYNYESNGYPDYPVVFTSKLKNCSISIRYKDINLNSKLHPIKYFSPNPYNAYNFKNVKYLEIKNKDYKEKYENDSK